MSADRIKETPEIVDCREIARKWNKEQVIIIALDEAGQMKVATFGRTEAMRARAERLGSVAFDAAKAYTTGLADHKTPRLPHYEKVRQ